MPNPFANALQQLIANQRGRTQTGLAQRPGATAPPSLGQMFFPRQFARTQMAMGGNPFGTFTGTGVEAPAPATAPVSAPGLPGSPFTGQVTGDQLAAQFPGNFQGPLGTPLRNQAAPLQAAIRGGFADPNHPAVQQFRAAGRTKRVGRRPTFDALPGSVPRVVAPGTPLGRGRA
jgi:hypothetical protein